MRYSPSVISSLRTNTPANGKHTGSRTDDLRKFASDKITEAVTSYGHLDSKIESLSQLSVLEGIRADLALLSLGRVYTRRCVSRGGSWTSGLHLAWWIRRRLVAEPIVTMQDIRDETALSLERQIDLAKWAILMLRLTVISDIGAHAKPTGHAVGALSDIAEEAAAATTKLSFRKLHRWVKSEGSSRFDRALPAAEYARLAALLHRDDLACGGPVPGAPVS
jgi:hypothetical protein